MSAIHEEAAGALLDGFMGSPDGACALQGYVANIRKQFWPKDYLDVARQQHWDGIWPYEQIAAFAHLHADLETGRLAEVQLTTFGATPAPAEYPVTGTWQLAELPVPRAAEERMPLAWREPEDRAAGVLAVAHADPAIRQARHLDAVAVGEAQRALDPP
jgi:hypothetical protein